MSQTVIKSNTPLEILNKYRYGKSL